MGYGNWGGCCSSIINGYGGLGFVGPILTLVITAGIIIGVIVLVIRAVRRLSSRPNTIMNQSNQQKNIQAPLEILQVRYAGGEITREEYLDMKKDLS